MSYMDWAASELTAWVMTDETIQRWVDEKPNWVTFQNFDFAVELVGVAKGLIEYSVEYGLHGAEGMPTMEDGLDHVSHAVVDQVIEKQEEVLTEIAPEARETAAQPEISTEIAGQTVDTHMEEIKKLQADHEAEVNKLHADRDTELRDQAQKDDNRIEALTDRHDIGAEGLKTLQESKDANQQMITNRFDAQEAEMKQRQTGELAALQEKQSGPVPPVAPPPPPPTPDVRTL